MWKSIAFFNKTQFYKCLDFIILIRDLSNLRILLSQKMTIDVAVPFIRMLADLKLYNHFMDRNVNLTPTDLSSTIKSTDSKEYNNR